VGGLEPIPAAIGQKAGPGQVASRNTHMNRFPLVTCVGGSLETERTSTYSSTDLTFDYFPFVFFIILNCT